jgi:hypothetical protein
MTVPSADMKSTQAPPAIAGGAKKNITRNTNKRIGVRLDKSQKADNLVNAFILDPDALPATTRFGPARPDSFVIPLWLKLVPGQEQTFTKLI